MASTASCWTPFTAVYTSDGANRAPISTSTHPPNPPDTSYSSGDTSENAHAAAYGDLHFGVEIKLAGVAGS